MAQSASTYPILFLLIATTGVGLKSVVAETNDNDYLRVSSNQFDGSTLNYHSITPARGVAPNAKQVARASVDVVNHIGKPLVALPAQRTPTKQPSVEYIQRLQPVAVVAAKAAVSNNNTSQGQQQAGLPPIPPLLARNSTADSPGSQAEQQQQQQPQSQPQQVVTKKQDGLATSQQPATRQPKPRSTTSASSANSKRHVQASYPVQQSLNAGQTSTAPTPPPAATGANTCKWMQLAEFKDVSFETGRMVFVDDTDQPCYILTMRAFVRWNDTLYFPLRNYRPHPRGSYKVSLRAPMDGAIGRLVLNCSMPELGPTAGASISLLPNQLAADYSFDEEITILVECGYLTLKLTGDDAHVALNSISFHQNADLADERPKDKKRRRYQEPTIITNNNDGDQQLRVLKSPESSDPAGVGAKDFSAVVLNKHQVFSSEAAHKAPLLIMPLISRYICQNRIVLNGSNLVQIVLERFELQRLLTEPPTVSSSWPLPQPSITTNAYRQRKNPRASSLVVTEGNYMFNTGEDNSYNGPLARKESELTPKEKVRMARLMNTNLRSRRSPHDTTILYKRPMLAVTRCPNPTSPTSPLNFMMDPGELGGNDSLDKIMANRRMAAARSSAMRAVNVVSSLHVGLVNLILTLYMVKRILTHSRDVHL